MKKILTIFLIFSVCAISMSYYKSADYENKYQQPITDIECDSDKESTEIENKDHQDITDIEYDSNKEIIEVENTLIQAIRLDGDEAKILTLLCAEHNTVYGGEYYADVLAQAVEAGFNDTEIKVLEWLLSEHPITSDYIYEISGRKIRVYDSDQKVFRTEVYPDTSQNNALSQTKSESYYDGTIRYYYNKNGKILREIRTHNKYSITVDSYFFYNKSGQIEESHLNYPYIKQSTDRYYIYNSDGTLNKVIVYEEEKLYMIFYFNDGTLFSPDNSSIASSQPALSGNYYKTEEYRTDDENSKVYLYKVDYFNCEPYFLEDTDILAYHRQEEHTDVFNSDGSLEKYIEYEHYTTDNLPQDKKARLSPYADSGESVVEENRYSADGTLLNYCLTYHDIETTERLRIEEFDAQGNLIYGWVN